MIARLKSDILYALVASLYRLEIASISGTSICERDPSLVPNICGVCRYQEGEYSDILQCRHREDDTPFLSTEYELPLELMQKIFDYYSIGLVGARCKVLKLAYCDTLYWHFKLVSRAVKRQECRIRSEVLLSRGDAAPSAASNRYLFSNLAANSTLLRRFMNGGNGALFY